MSAKLQRHRYRPITRARSRRKLMLSEPEETRRKRKQPRWLRCLANHRCHETITPARHVRDESDSILAIASSLRSPRRTLRLLRLPRPPATAGHQFALSNHHPCGLCERNEDVERSLPTSTVSAPFSNRRSAGIRR